MQNEQDYWIIINKNYSTKRKLSTENLNFDGVLYLIQCNFLSLTSSKLHSYYSHKCFDNTGQLLENNEIIIKGIRCQIKEKESWEIVNNYSHQSMALQVKFIDLNGNEKIKNFDNVNHSETVYNEIIEYALKLAI